MNFFRRPAKKQSKKPHRKHHNESPREKGIHRATSRLLKSHLWLQILIGMALGVGTGMLLSPEVFGLVETKTAYMMGEWIALPGVVFLGLIKMVIIPLVACSIILGITDSDNVAFLKYMGLRIVPYFIITTVISISIGIVLVELIHPGQLIDKHLLDTVMNSKAAANQLPATTFSNLTVPQRIANIIPTNLARAELNHDMLQIVVAAIIAGVSLVTMPRKTSKPLLDLCLSIQVLTMTIIGWGLLIAPYAVFGLLCNITIRVGVEALFSVGLYMITVLLGLFCMFIIYMTILKLLAGRKPLGFLAAIREVQLLAFSTSSSAATMPFSIEAAEDNLDIRPEISRFVIPLGATVNMDGTALYQAVAALFLCQVFGIHLDTAQIITLLVTTVGASIGTPATPGVGIVVLATIIGNIGVPAEGIALIIGVDRILDMCRTTVNVTGDLVATAVMQRWVPKAKEFPKPAYAD